MTEISRPWAGVTVGDAGPYTDANWWDVWHLLHHGAGSLSLSNIDNVGVLWRSSGRHTAWVANTAYNVGDIVQPTTENNLFYVCTVAGTSHAASEPLWPTTKGITYADNTVTWTTFGGGLAARSPSINTVNVHVGGGLVDGTYHHSTAIEAVAIPNATAGNVRDDRIVLRKTFGAVTQTVRITRLVGGEVAAPGPGTPPSLTQDTARGTFWDVPLWRASVTDAGVITLTDEREFVDVVSRNLFAPPLIGRNVTGAADVPLSWDGTFNTVIQMTDPNNVHVNSRFIAPADFLADMSMQGIIIVGSTGNVYVAQFAWYGTCGEPYVSHQDLGSLAVVAITGTDDYYCLADLDIESVYPADIVNIQFQRDGSDVLDTMGVTVSFLGFFVQYLGWR